MTPRRVAVTGAGAVCALGDTLPQIAAAALRGHVGIGPLTLVPTDRLNVRIAAQAGIDLEGHFDHKRRVALDRTAQLALVAGREAVASAAEPFGDPASGGVVLAASIGLETFDSSYQAFYGERLNRVPPLTVPRIMPSAAASHLSMAFGLRGPSYSVATACASSNHAIGQAFHMVRSGMLDVALTGGADAPITPGFMKGWEALRVLSPDGCRPFSADRNGLVIGEGAAVFVLEPMDRAQARGATILAEIVGFGMSADAADLTAPDPRGAAAAMRMALADAGRGAEEVGYVNAHGTGTRLNDRTESAALRLLFGARLAEVPVSSTKSMVGHCMTASGAIELAVTIAALQAGRLPPTAGFAASDPECEVDCVPAARSGTFDLALSNSFAFGGLNAVLAVARA